MKIDLHTHSTVSDGTEAPADVAAAAAAAGLDAFALTDHDSTAGWAECADAATRLGMVFVPGMEISCSTTEGISVHVLSYLHDPHNQALQAETERTRISRKTRAERMVERLSEDFPISWRHVAEHVTPGASVGRPHIADALVTAGIVTDRSEAFTEILTPKSRYFVSHYAPNPVDAVALVRAAGGVPVFAHPVAHGRGRVVGTHTFSEMIEAGLLGLEVEHRDNPPEGREWLRQLADEHHLLATGSSDYHGAGKTNQLGEFLTSAETLDRIEALAGGAAVVRP